MVRFQWNALHTGDAVFVHDAFDPDAALLHGEVVIVDTARRGNNNVAIRLDAEHQVVRPERLNVHRDPLDPTEDCWRCAGRARATAASGTTVTPA